MTKINPMKKIVIFSALCLVSFSCKKSYQCECRRVVNGEDWNPIVTNSALKDTKKNAESQCKSLGYSFGWQDYQSCQLK